LVNEGRIVMAGAVADRGDVDGAVRMLAKGWKRPSAPKEHHLRRAYALADLYERSGDVPRARALFHWIVSKAPDFVDSAQRLRSLR
jgi:lipopolysaccharide biosynthesis regulator YciM